MYHWPYHSLCPIHTADGTKLFCGVGVGGVNTNSQLVGDSFVVSSVWTHPSTVVTEFTISCADKWRYNDVIVLTVIKFYEYYTTRLIRMFRNTQRHMLHHSTSVVLTANCKRGHGRRLRSHRRIRRQSWPSLQFPVLTSDDIMPSLFKKL